MSFQGNLKAVWVSFRPVLKNTVNNLLLNCKMRFYSAKVPAVQRLSFRSPHRRKKTTNYGAYLLPIIPVSAFGLGTWQVFRKFEKEKEIEVFMEKIKQPPVELPENLDELQDMEFRAVKVRGKFDHSRELYLGPRPEIADDPITKVSTLLSRDKGGFVVVTPFKLSDRNLTILVNRGWVPAQLKSPLTRKQGQITEEVEIVGLVRSHQAREPLGMKNMPELGYWVYRDLYKMAEVAETAPVLIDADKASSVPGGPMGGQTVLEIRNIHISYIYTWYGLSILTSWLWFKRYRAKNAPVFPYLSRAA